MNRTAILVGAGVASIFVVGGAGFLFAQTRVIERAPDPPEELAMITVEDLVGETPAVAYSPERLVRVFPSMPMLWLDYRRSGDVELRSHLLRYDDVAMATTAVERFAEGDGRWLSSLEGSPMALPSCLDEGSLSVQSGVGFILAARHGGTYVHVSGTGWAPESPLTLARGICPSLDALDALPWPPE